MSYTVDFAPTWMRRYSSWAKVSAIVCAGLMSFIAVVSGLDSPINNVAAIANAFGRGPPSLESATPSQLISASTSRGLELRNEPASIFAGRFAFGSDIGADVHADSTSPRTQPGPSFPARRRAGAVATDTEQIAIDRGVRPIQTGSGAIS